MVQIMVVKIGNNSFTNCGSLSSITVSKLLELLANRHFIIVKISKLLQLRQVRCLLRLLVQMLLREPIKSQLLKFRQSK